MFHQHNSGGSREEGSTVEENHQQISKFEHNFQSTSS